MQILVIKFGWIHVFVKWNHLFDVYPGGFRIYMACGFCGVTRHWARHWPSSLGVKQSPKTISTYCTFTLSCSFPCYSFKIDASSRKPSWLQVILTFLDLFFSCLPEYSYSMQLHIPKLSLPSVFYESESQVQLLDCPYEKKVHIHNPKVHYYMLRVCLFSWTASNLKSGCVS